MELLDLLPAAIASAISLLAAVFRRWTLRHLLRVTKETVELETEIDKARKKRRKKEPELPDSSRSELRFSPSAG